MAELNQKISSGNGVRCLGYEGCPGMKGVRGMRECPGTKCVRYEGCPGYEGVSVEGLVKA